jgi:hypothetical protein
VKYALRRGPDSRIRGSRHYVHQGSTGNADKNLDVGRRCRTWAAGGGGVGDGDVREANAMRRAVDKRKQRAGCEPRLKRTF